MSNRGLLAPVYYNPDTKSFISEDLNENILKKLKLNSKCLDSGKSRTFFYEHDDFDMITAVNLSEKPPKSEKVDQNNLNKTKEFTRKAIANAVKSFKDSKLDSVQVSNNFTDHSTVSEAIELITWNYKLKEQEKFPKFKNLETTGQSYALAQNFARFLMESPANKMTPEIFAETVVDQINKWDLKDRIEVKIRDKEWIKEQDMGAFLSVAAGSDLPPVFLEIHVNKPKNKEIFPKICLVGKGVTFDSGGISIKPSAQMDQMRADMGGAATTIAATLGAAKLNKIDEYFCCITPLCENMPSGTATRPGDVITAKNGKTIQVDNTDAEGRLILADALTYAEKDLKAESIINAATLTGAMAVALGAGASGVFSRSDSIYTNLEKAGYKTGDRMWRMPLFELYLNQIKKSPTADLNNIGGGRMGGSCTAAAFLSEFVENENWAHIDIAGVMTNTSEVDYINSGMSGRPTRTFMKYLEETLV